MPDRYPAEILAADIDNGTMPENVQALAAIVVGRRIVAAELGEATYTHPQYAFEDSGYGLILTLDDGTRAILAQTDDCCAHTEVQSFLLAPAAVDHIITGVGTTDGYETWHIYADFGDVLTMQVGWSSGNPFYYGYGFDIAVLPVAEAQS